MSTSILYHGFGVVGYYYKKTEYLHGSVIFHIERNPSERCCKDCGSKKVIKKGRFRRQFKTVPIGSKEVYLSLIVHRLCCKSCGSLKLEPIPLAFPKKHWTKNLGRYILDLMEFATIEDVADHLNMSWDTVKDIHKWALKKKFKKKKLKNLEYLGVDELAVRKGHNYMTIVVDLKSGSVVWAAEDRKTSSVEPFFKRLKRMGAPIKAIAMDMWPAYIKAARDIYSYKVIVFDKYHIISECNKIIDELRRIESQSAEKNKKKSIQE